MDPFESLLSQLSTHYNRSRDEYQHQIEEYQFKVEQLMSQVAEHIHQNQISMNRISELETLLDRTKIDLLRTKSENHSQIEKINNEHQKQISQMKIEYEKQIDEASQSANFPLIQTMTKQISDFKRQIEFYSNQCQSLKEQIKRDMETPKEIPKEIPKDSKKILIVKKVISNPISSQEGSITPIGTFVQSIPNDIGVTNQLVAHVSTHDETTSQFVSSPLSVVGSIEQTTQISQPVKTITQPISPSENHDTVTGTVEQPVKTITQLISPSENHDTVPAIIEKTTQVEQPAKTITQLISPSENHGTVPATVEKNTPVSKSLKMIKIKNVIYYMTKEPVKGEYPIYEHNSGHPGQLIGRKTSEGKYVIGKYT